MDDKDNLYFSFDDEQEEAEPEKEVKAEEGGNRSFVFIAIVLGGLFLLVICGTVGYFMFGSQITAMLGGQPPTDGPSSNELTNQVMSTLISMTQTASFETQTAPTEVPTDTPAPQPSDTPASEVEITDVGTQVAEVTQEGTPGTPGTPGTETTPGLAGAATTAAPGTGTATLGAGTAASGSTTTTPTVKPTSSIIEVTPLGGSTPTQLVSGSATSSIIEVTTAGGQGGGVGVTPTGKGGPTTPGAAATIPTTGFAGGAGLAGAGVLAMLLVVVVVVVRKIRLNDK